MRSILRIDMGGATGPTASLEPDGSAGLEGHALASLLVAGEVDPGCHPLGAGNRLVLAPGVAPWGAEAVSIGCKSPLTGGIAASDAEAPGAAVLRWLGYAAIVVEGQPAGDDLWTIAVDGDGVAFATENGLRMLGAADTLARLRGAHGAGAALLAIGPAGEVALAAASVTSPGRGGRPVRHCGRGGAGAVMGSKRIKAIVLGGAGATEEAGALGPDGRAAPSPYRDACGIRDAAVLDRLLALEDDLGVDGDEIAAALSLAMEAGLARHGDGAAALRLVEEIGRWTPLGRIVGSGLLAMAEAFGLEPRLARWGIETSPAAAGEGDPAARLHPIVFGAIDDDLARLFGTLDPQADPFDPQLQLPVGLRPARPAEPGAARSLRRALRRLPGGS